MTTSLKKQILQKKGNRFIKNFDIVLIFTIFEKPQENRQLIKIFFSENFTKNKSDFLSNSTFYSSGQNPKVSQRNNKISLKKETNGEYIFEKENNDSLEKKYKINPVLHINNKSLKSLSNKFPTFYGPITLIGFASSDYAEKKLMYLKSLFKIGFLGGFYKGEFLTKKTLKDLCFNISHKREVYKNFLKIFLLIPYKNYKTIKKTNIKFTYLCKNLNLLKKKEN